MGARGSKRWGHHGGTRIGNEPGNESVATEKGHEMADLSPRDYRDQPREAHGKEGVNGSSPLEGFLRSGHLPPRTHPRETSRHGTHEGTLRGLAVTGGVITSAGVVLAGTFLVLGVLPLVALTEIG